MSTGPDATEVTGPAPPPPCDPAARRTGIVLAVLLVVVSFTGVVFQSLWNGTDANWASLIWTTVREGWPQSEPPPPLLMLLAALCRVSGRVTPWLLRSVSACGAFGVLVLVHRMVRARSGPPAAGPGLAPWAAAFTCATAALFARHARLVASEMPSTFAVTLALFLFWWAWSRTAAGPRWPAFVPFALALTACAVGGLGAPALVVLGAGCFLARERRWVALAALAGTAAAALVAGRIAFGFVAAGVSNRAWWEQTPFALRTLPGAMLPWTLPVALALVAYVRPGTRFREPLDRFVRSVLGGLLAATVVSAGAREGVQVVFFIPWLAIACGVWIAERSAAPRPGFGVRLAVNATAFVTWLALLAVPIGFLYGQMAFPDTVRVAGRLGLSELRAVVALVATLAIGWTYMRCRRRHRATMWPLAPAGAAALAVAAFGVAGPVIEYNRTLAPLVQVLRAETVPTALAVQRSGDEGVLTLALGERLVPAGRTEDAAAWLAGPPPRALVAPAGRFPEFEAQARAGAFALVPVDGGRHAREYVVFFTKPPPAR